MAVNYKTLFSKIIEEGKNKYNSRAMLMDIEQHCSPSHIKDKVFYIIVNSIDLYNFLQDINISKFNEIATKLYQDTLEIKFISPDEHVELIKNDTKEKEIISSKLDKELTFNTYIIGDYNKKAASILKATIQKDQFFFNPVFIYGNTGIGKTHLVNAFAYEYLKIHPERKIKFINAESFSREIYEIISSSQKIEEFKRENSKYDVFIMEDIQFLCDKQKSNEIFFTIFNTLYSNKHLIILTSDRNPEHLNGFTDRMISRFSSGIIIQVESPDEKSIKQITIERLKDANLKLTDAAIDLIVRYHYRDIRKLLGSINLILFISSYQDNKDKIIDEDEVREILKIDNNVGKNNLTLETGLNPQFVINSVAKIYSLKASDIIGPSRKAKNVNARAMAMYIMREKLCIPFETIGSFFSNRSHSTTIACINKFINNLKTNPELGTLVEQIIKKI